MPPPWHHHDHPWHRRHRRRDPGPHGRHPWHGPPWREAWKHGWRQEWRRYYGAHLHRRLFWWFGAAIFVTALLLYGLHRLAQSQWHDRPPAVLLFLVPMLAMWVLSGKIAYRLARPLRELSEVAEEIGRGNLQARARIGSYHGIDEIAFVAGSINDMAAHIERQLAEQRELLAAVSHELRTPLARLRVLVDIARQRGSHEQTVAEIEKEILEMDQLVGELLASARLDFAALTTRPLDAVDAARRALERAGLSADKLVASQATLPLTADPTLLARALANLIDNARKHGGGLDRIRLYREGDEPDPAAAISFEIDDRGPGFTPGQEHRVFEPFVRTGDAPNPEPAPPGLGLGLALVARIARAHGGKVAAANRPEGGARLTFQLPLRPTGTGAAGSSSTVR
jgi:two-component system OmpR family sensor kinase